MRNCCPVCCKCLEKICKAQLGGLYKLGALVRVSSLGSVTLLPAFLSVSRVRRGLEKISFQGAREAGQRGECSGPKFPELEPRFSELLEPRMWKRAISSFVIYMVTFVLIDYIHSCLSNCVSSGTASGFIQQEL